MVCPMAELVECRSDSDYAGRPVAVYWQGERLEVQEVLARWRTPGGIWFRVTAGRGQVFELCYDEGADAWRVILM
jgi:hypothetical protein